MLNIERINNFNNDLEEGGGRYTFKKIQLSVSWMKITYCSTIYPPYIP